MNRRKAILHIGTMKTGTSSIQAMLKQNTSWLAAQGHAFFPGTQRMSAAIKDRIAKLEPDQNLIISDEGLWHFGNSARSDTEQIAAALQDFDVTIIVYFRRPDQFMEAWFVQGLKNGGGSPIFSDFEQSLYVKGGCNFIGRLAIFTRAFGRGAIRIAPYERAQLAQGDVVIDFLKRTGLCAPDATHDDLSTTDLVWPVQENISPEINVILLTSMLRQMGNVPEAVLRQVQTSARPTKGPKTQLLQQAERDQINARYLPMFQRLQREFGGGATGDFFLDWTSTSSAPMCALRPAYDQLITAFSAAPSTATAPAP